MKTNSELKWRLESLKGNDEFYLVNASSESENGVQEVVKELLSSQF